jgi:tetratricopeptide (TPR) repeat protein
LSSKKDKLLESAQKFIAKGQLDRAIKEYGQIVALDSGDIRQRQKLAELLVRVNRKEEAIAEYELIAKQFSKDLFYLKAIAVYKQVQKLDPANINTRISLAALYAKQGLTGNALAEYTLALTHYQKEGLLAEALTLLEQMLSADPQNLDTHQKYAETCLAAGQNDKAYLEFVRLALLLRKGGDEKGSARIRERVGTLFPDDRGFDFAILSTQIEEGDTAGALPHLQRLLQTDNADAKAWQLMARSYLKAQETGAGRSMLENIISTLSDLPTALDKLTAAVIAEGDMEVSLDLLEAQKEIFPTVSLEGYYASLRDKAPNNARVLQGLKIAGKDGGETEQPAGAVAAIDSLPLESSDKGEEQAPSPACEAPEVSELPPAAPMTPADDMSWEEEIDLSLLEEDGMNPLFADTGEDISAFPVSLADPRALPDLGLEREDIFQGEDISIESQDFSEISLEIDESDISDSKWLQDFTPLEPADAGSMETVWEAGEGPVGIQPEEGKSESPTAAESTFRGEGDSPVTDTVEIREKAEKAPPVVKKRIKYVLDGQFSESNDGAGQQLDKGDTETHFNLGIAYKEMGLFDEAISEFQTAATDPKRKIDCLTLEGICQRDKGDFAGAEDVFVKTLALDGLTDEEKLSLKYELAFLCESTGRQEDAVRYYREVRAINPGFRDAAKKIAHLQGSDEPEDTELLELDVEEFDP